MAINRHTNIDKQNILKNFDFVLLFLTLCAAVFGMVMIMSATASPFKYVLVQGFALILGLVAIFFLMVVDYEYLAKMNKYLYGISVIILLSQPPVQDSATLKVRPLSLYFFTTASPSASNSNSFIFTSSLYINFLYSVKCFFAKCSYVQWLLSLFNIC